MQHDVKIKHWVTLLPVLHDKLKRLIVEEDRIRENKEKTCSLGYSGEMVGYEPLYLHHKRLRKQIKTYVRMQSKLVATVERIERIEKQLKVGA